MKHLPPGDDLLMFPGLRGQNLLKKNGSTCRRDQIRSEMAHGFILAKQQQLDVRLPEQPIWMEGDAVRLAQVVLNLLDNASKYSPEGGRIEIVAQQLGAESEIQVRDNGTGISAELLPTIFDLFQQGTRTLDRSQGGLGIGLTVVKRLVEMHGGEITASSPGTGLGSTFSIRLPTLNEGITFPTPRSSSSRPSTAMRTVDDDSGPNGGTGFLLTADSR